MEHITHISVLADVDQTGHVDMAFIGIASNPKQQNISGPHSMQRAATKTA
jgi:hypothetical protein